MNLRPQSRGSMKDSTGVHDTIVNQLLSKIDGVNQLNNILIIGTASCACMKTCFGVVLMATPWLYVYVRVCVRRYDQPQGSD